MNKYIAAFVAIIGCAFLAAPASANVVTLGGAATIECNDANDATVDCLGIVGGSLVVTNPGNQVTGGTPGNLDDIAPFTADLYNVGNNSESNEATALNTLTAGTAYATSFTGADATRIDMGGVAMAEITTWAEWIVIAMGAGQTFIHNTSGGALTIDFAQFAGAGGGFSHYTEFGEVPVPGAVWLMFAGLAGLGFASRRKATI